MHCVSLTTIDPNPHQSMVPEPSRNHSDFQKHEAELGQLQRLPYPHLLALLAIERAFHLSTATWLNYSGSW